MKREEDYLFTFLLYTYHASGSQQQQCVFSLQPSFQYTSGVSQLILALCNSSDTVMIFLLFVYTHLPHVGLSCRAFIMFSLSSFCSISSPCILSTHVYHSYFDACTSYMLLTCLIFTYLLHAMQAWLTCIKLVCRPSLFSS